MKYVKLIGNSIIIFAIAFVSHFIYDLIPNFFTSIIFPINESIFEHMKLIFTPYVIFYFIRKDKNLFNTWIIGFSGIISYLSFYFILGYFIQVSLFFDISLLFFNFVLMEIIYNKFSKKIKIIPIIGIIFVYFMFYYLSYYPPHNFLFFDTETKTYGIAK